VQADVGGKFDYTLLGEDVRNNLTLPRVLNAVACIEEAGYVKNEAVIE
jgi:hypothetical protein